MKKNNNIGILTLIVLFAISIFPYLVFRGNFKSLLKLNQVINVLEDDYYMDIDRDSIIDYALTGMLLSAEDPYSRYYNAERFDKYRENSLNSFIGIGIVIGIDNTSENIEIKSVINDSSAHLAGIMRGDIILEINQKKVSPDDFSIISKLIKGKGNKPAILKIRRNGEELTFTVDLTTIKKDTVQSKNIDETIGYIKISGFDIKDPEDENSIDTYEEFKEEVDKLINANISKIILDLRDNPGGNLAVVTKIADYLLPEGVITYTETKKGKRDYTYSDNDCIDAEFVVLINNNSASASELLTGALRDYNRATIVGEKSYGKGVAQSIYKFKDGSGLSLTTAKYYLPNGDCIHGTGITPDYVIKDSHEQLQKAIQLLKNK